MKKLETNRLIPTVELMKKNFYLLIALLIASCQSLFAATGPTTVNISKTLQLGESLTINPWTDFHSQTFTGSLLAYGSDGENYFVDGKKNDTQSFDVTRKTYSGNSHPWSTSTNYPYSYCQFTLRAKTGGTFLVTVKVGYIWCYVNNGTNTSEYGTGTVNYTIRVPDITSISLSPNSVSLNVGATTKLTATIVDSDCTKRTLTWSSDDTSIATVNSGTVTGVSEGQTTIRYKSSNGVEGKCTVTVKSVAVSSITLPSTGISLHTGDTYQLSPTVIPSNATNKSISWSSSNSQVATVTSGGLVKAVGLGSAVITGTAMDGNGAKVTCNVTVTNIPVTSISLNATSYQDVTVGQSYQLTATVTPSNATNKNVTWSSSNTSVVTVSSTGLAKTVGIGQATVTCTAKDGSGVKASCSFKVVATKVSGITLNKTSCVLNKGEKTTLIATISPESATNQGVSWTSSNTTVATVDANGEVTAVKTGSANITCTAKDGSGVSATCRVTVNAVQVTGITLNLTTALIGTSNTQQLTATVSPSDADERGVRWSSSATNVATVNSDGLVTAQGKGSAVITCTAIDGSGMSATCAVTVAHVYPQSLTIQGYETPIVEGNTLQLLAIPTPSNTTYNKYNWSSINTSVATVDANGLVTAVSEGTATIKCVLSYSDGTTQYFAPPGEQTATCVITVEKNTSIVKLIDFADAEVKRICVENWDANGDGELSLDEAASVADLGTIFKGNNTIKTFNELQYFKGIISLPDDAFQMCMNLENITLPSTLQTIGHSVFENCSKLQTIGLPEGLESISWAAFSSCSALQSINIPTSLKILGTSSNDTSPFDYCESLTTITVAEGNTVFDSRENCNAIIETATNTLRVGCKNTIIPSSVIALGHLAFAGCKEMTSLTIPSSVKTIGNQVFISCTGLKEISFPSSLESIGYACFSGAGLTKVHLPASVKSLYTGGTVFPCKELTSITVDEANATFDSRDNCNAIIRKSNNQLVSGCSTTIIPTTVTSIGQSAFKNAGFDETITIPENVKTINNYAFMYSTLKSIKIPSSVTSIGSAAFDGCGLLTSVTVDILEPLTIDKRTFSNRSNATLFVPYGCKAAYEVADYWKEFKDIVEIDSRSEQTLELITLPTMTYGDAAYTLPATTAEGQTLTWGCSNAFVATISGNVLTIKGSGTTAVTATQAGNDNNKPFSREFTLTVNKAMLTITANDCTKQQGEANPALTVSYSGFKYNDDASSLTTQPSVTTTATVDSPEGTYPITVSGTVSNNYEFTYVSGTLTVTEKPVVIASDISQIDNVIYIEPMEETKGSEVVVPILMKNTAAIRGFQFDLVLPDGVTVAKTSKGKYVCSLSSGRLPEDDEHTLSVSEQEDGTIRFLCGSQYNETFTGNNGEIATIKLLITEDMKEGIYPIVLKKVKLSETDISNFYFTETVQTILTVISYIPGDISGEGEVDVSDYIGVANFIMGDKPEGFIEAAADVNKDKVVDVSDYIGVANIILYGNIYGPVANASRSAANREVTSASENDNHIYVEHFTVAANSQTTVSFKMKNTADIRGFQFDLYLPKGISVVKNEKNRILGLIANKRMPEGDNHTLTLSEQEDGAIRFLCNSMNDETFTGNDGEVATLTVNITGNMTQGDYPILLKKMKLSETNIDNCYETESRMATFTISNNSATGIKQLATNRDNETYYNLQGQRVNTPSKGVFVKNGKKVMIK